MSPHSKFNHFPHWEDANIGTTSKELYEKVSNNKRHSMRGVFFRTYASESSIRDFIRDTTPVAWAYILHDKDVDAEGNVKAPHYHVLCKWDSACFRVGYLARYTEGQQTEVEAPRSYVACYKYELHEGCPDKHQYSPDEVVSFRADILTATAKQEKERKNESLIDDLESGLSMRELATKYGRDYMLNYKRYDNFVADMNCDDVQRELEAIERDYTDSTAFEIAGVDYGKYCLHRNGELLDYLANCLGNLASPCTWEVLRNFLVDFQRNDKAVRNAYIRAMLREEGEI